MAIYTKSLAARRAQVLRKYANSKRDKTKPYKVPKLYDRERIAELIALDLSLNEVAKRIGCSAWVVQVVKKEMIARGFRPPPNRLKPTQCAASPMKSNGF